MNTIFHPLGYPVEIASARPEPLEAAARLWEGWPALFDAPPLRIEVRVHRGAGPCAAPHFIAPVRFEGDDLNFAQFDPVSGAGLIAIAAAALDTVRFRHHFLEALVLTALDTVFFTPLHAACVVQNREGILLCGDSGAGKSSLAYACASRGWTLVSDDAVHVAPGPERIGVGGSNIIRLREPARALFANLSRFDTAIAPNGKQAIEIHAAAHGFRSARCACLGPCVFLKRRPGPPRWGEFSKSAAIAYFLKYLFPRDTARAAQRLKELLDSPPLLLQYEHVEDAAAAMESLVEAAI